jgi:tRNA (cytidine/uridine-2'-O-)-methyltransferase
MIEIALYEPDIAPNTATILRMGACLGVAVHVIDPVGFDMSERAFRRAGMDYVKRATMVRHDSWRAFLDAVGTRRLLLFTTRSARSYLDVDYGAGDILLFGRESAGAPDHVHDRADARLTIPMRPGFRSLNVAVACAIATGEALRQSPSL